MKYVRNVLPFVAVLVMLVGSVLVAKMRYASAGNVFPVNTMPDGNGEVRTVRVFDTMDLVLVIDRDNHRKKKKIPLDDCVYDRTTTRLTFLNPLPFAEPVIHVKGKSVQPERFCLYDAPEEAEKILVLLKDREAILDYEYSFDAETKMLTFRSDIHPERDGNFHIMYETADGETYSFGNWGKKDGDKLAELQWNWMHRTLDAPMLVMKDRSSASRRALKKKTGFFVDLPKGNATFLSETMEGTEKRLSLLRWYDDAGLVVTCRAYPFERTEEVADGVSVYEWEKRGTYYQMTADAEQKTAAEAFVARVR
mgnify:CR=1 FL=1